MASSLDQVGVLTKTVEDAEILLNAIRWFDTHDSNSDKKSDTEVKSDDIDPKSLKIAIPKETLAEGLDPKIKERFLETVEKIKKAGITIEEISLPILSYSVPMYYTIMPAEVSTNLSRFDWIKFGHQGDTMWTDTIQDYYKKMRSEWFGEEAKRRILLGTFVLSSENYEWYYLRAQKAREQLIADMNTTYEKYDIVLTPTVPEVAWKLWENADDPLKNYLADLYTIPANMAWLPAMSVPMWTIEDQGEDMPIGIQLMANRWNESKIFALGKVIEGLV